MFWAQLKDDDGEVDIDKILAKAEEESIKKQKQLDKLGESAEKKFTLDEIESISVYDFEG